VPNDRCVGTGRQRVYAVIKRSVDLTVSLLALAGLGPALSLLVLLVRLSMGPPVFFRQQRAGLHGRPFTVLKFRTMMEAYGPDGRLLPDRQRLTRLGRLVRAFSIDELPQLWNVLRGDMSLVGPRPLLMEYLDRYSPRQRRRHEVKPGITGWAQIHGRNAVTWEQKFELDVWYVDHWSLWLDLGILLSTAWKVMRREDISQPGEATMAEFMGEQASLSVSANREESQQCRS
jgi:sugar transferase EpsL